MSRRAFCLPFAVDHARNRRALVSIRPAWDRIVAACWWLAIPLLALPALWPFYKIGLPRSFDGGLHLLRLGVLDTHLRHGVLFPRWVPEMMLGYGYPLFNFYAPSTYYLAEALHLLGFSFYMAFILAFVMVVLAAGLGMYQLAKDIFGGDQRWSALVAATAYMTAPYLLTNVYMRGALAEAAAQALLPWIFWSMRRLLRSPQPSAYCLPVVLTLGGLAVTHNITLLFLPPVLLGYLALQWWQGERQKSTLLWALLSLLLAMGISAFFWLPLLGERQYLATTAYEIAKNIWLPGSVWTWENFLDRGWAFTHAFERPVRLGLVQLLLAIVGFLLARRRDGEWLFWGVVALAAGLLMGAWALPLWLSNELLVAAQFTWRLLSILSLPLALFAGGLVRHWRAGWQQTVVGMGLLLIILLAHQPRLLWMDVFAAEGTDITTPVLAQIEIDKGTLDGGEGNSSIQEFKPRWVDTELQLAPEPELAALPIKLVPQQANAYTLDLQVSAAQGGPLRFNQAYFPGWQVILDGDRPLATYPTTNLGLLTVDLPAGDYNLRLTWVGTALQRGAGLLSLFALALLIGIGWRQKGPRWLVAVPTLLLIFGVAATYWPASLTPVQTPNQAGQLTVEASGVRLLGLRTERLDPTHLYLYPTWYAVTTPPKGWRAQWQLVDNLGTVRAKLFTGQPYFNTLPASNWPPGTVVNDAYALPLPPGLPAGEYQVVVRFGANPAAWAEAAIPVGIVNLSTSAPSQAQPDYIMHARIGTGVRLAGFTAKIADRELPFINQNPPTVYAGEDLRYTLYWQATAPVAQNYHGFIHLTDINGKPVVQQDQLPGPFFRHPKLWDSYYLQPDIYRLRVPRDAPGGLYWPAVGMYVLATQDRLPVYISGLPPSDRVRLPPVKIIGASVQKPTQLTPARFDGLGQLLGYDLTLPAPRSNTTIQAGEQLTVTLYYQSETDTQRDYTRFLHLYSPSGGMVAQNDNLPQAGVNPTWSWVPGEVIVEQVTLQIDAQTPPGVYPLSLGFYDAKAEGLRVPARTLDGSPLLDDQVILTEVVVGSEQ